MKPSTAASPRSPPKVRTSASSGGGGTVVQLLGVSPRSQNLGFASQSSSALRRTDSETFENSAFLGQPQALCTSHSTNSPHLLQELS
eukprot:964019-Pyramimonas_sp.AAC.1